MESVALAAATDAGARAIELRFTHGVGAGKGSAALSSDVPLSTSSPSTEGCCGGASGAEQRSVPSSELALRGWAGVGSGSTSMSALGAQRVVVATLDDARACAKWLGPGEQARIGRRCLGGKAVLHRVRLPSRGDHGLRVRPNPS